ncbi:unnamed protein product [Cochlearia groenlandica]
MDKHRNSKHPRPEGVTEVSSLEWEQVAMTQEEEDLIYRMYNLLGPRWELIAGRIPGRRAQEIKRFWLMKNHHHLRSSQ